MPLWCRPPVCRQLVLFSVRLSALAVVLSDMLVQGFTTGAAVHVLLSQVPSVLGLPRPRFSGAGRLIKVLAGN